jgi:CheY-like chemotaxis protein
MSESEQPGHLRVLIADERKERLDHVTSVVTSLGHTVIAEATDIGMVAALTSDELPDVAIVCLDDNSEHTLDMIRHIVRESACPVIALLDVEDADFINQAAQVGIFAYIVNGEAERLQSAFGVALRRFAEYHGLEGHSQGAPSPNAPKASSWNAIESTSTPPSKCSGTTHAAPIRNWSTSPKPSTAPTCSSPANPTRLTPTTNRFPDSGSPLDRESRGGERR